MRIVAASILLVGLMGCGAEGGGGSSSGGVSVPQPPTLQSIQIMPGDSAIGLGDSVALTVVGTYSNGAMGPVTAAWSSSNPGSVSLSAANGTAVTATGAGPGSADIRAQVNGLQDLVAVTVSSSPSDPGPLYAHTGAGQILKYLGEGNPATVVASGVGDRGIAMNAAGTEIYALVYSASNVNPVMRVDVGTGATSLLAEIATDRPFGLERDSEGRLYTLSYAGAGNPLIRITPSTGAVESVADLYGSYLDLAIDPDDVRYYQPLYCGEGGFWITRHDPVTGALFPWGQAPPGISLNGFVIPGGLAANEFGELFILDANSPTVYKFVDLNGDGDAWDAGERTEFGTIPGVYADSFTIGLAATRGRGVVVNAQPGNTSAYRGLYWLADRNNDGDAADAGEVTRYGEDFANGWGGSGLVAK